MRRHARFAAWTALLAWAVGCSPTKPDDTSHDHSPVDSTAPPTDTDDTDTVHTEDTEDTRDTEDTSVDTKDTSDTDAPVPRRWIDVSCAWDFCCGIDEDEQIVCWGERYLGTKVGFYDAGIQRDIPKGAFAQISVHHKYACALDHAGIATCWGSNYYDQDEAPEEPLAGC